MIEVKSDGGFYVFERDGMNIYDISHAKCKTERSINEWIAHMAEKSWWNEKIENEFIKLWKIQNKFE